MAACLGWWALSGIYLGALWALLVLSPLSFIAFHI